MAAHDVAQTVFGFELSTPFPLLTGRLGPGAPLHVDFGEDVPPSTGEPLLRWSPGPANPLDARLFERPAGGYQLDIADAGRYVIDPDRSTITIPADSPPLLREVRLLGLPLMLSFLDRGDLSLHAAAVEVNGAAILLAAPGRHGKTSLAATFARNGHRILTEDLSCVRPGKGPQLVPGPATLRVRPDMSQILPIPDMVEVGRLDERLVLASTSPGDCEPVPIAGIVLLKDFGPHLTIDKVEGASVLADLWLLSLHLPTEDDRKRKFAQLVDLIDSVNVWNVIQPDDRSALADTVAALISRVTTR